MPKPHAIVFSSFCLAVAGTAALELKLAGNGRTDYRIVLPDTPSSVDMYAGKTLAGYMRQVTGTEFLQSSADRLSSGSPAIYVGLSDAAKRKLGEPDPLVGLAEQEHVSRSVGKDIFLYGNGIHGNLHAVMEFLENSLGWRWYSVFEEPVVPSRPQLVLESFDRKRCFAFPVREVQPRYGLDFYYQNGLNMGFGRRTRRVPEADEESVAGIVPYLSNDKFVHSSFAYIPPTPDSHYSKSFDWQTKFNYFETNPDFFSMGRNGKRVPNRQLCFSNPALRVELTDKIRLHMKHVPDNRIITLDAADATDKFCYCTGCEALEKKYGSPGGPIYDYLIELCHVVQAEYPGVFVKTLAYRRSQTQKPPILPEGEMLPDNLIIAFAPIEDCYFADWTHPDSGIQETYRDLQSWKKVTKNLWAWLYPNPWGSGAISPVGNVDRLITNVRLMHKAGVTGVFTDHNGFTERAGWSELQSYVLYKLIQDIDCDTDVVIREFTDHQYGEAAPLVRTYLRELEDGRKAMKTLPPRTTYTSRDYGEKVFPYLTTGNMHRWQGLFDEMLSAVSADSDYAANVRILRRELDFATLSNWFALRDAYPDTFTDWQVVKARIEAANAAKAPRGMRPRPLGERELEDFCVVLEVDGMKKPLPSFFDGIDPARIRSFLPMNTSRQAVRRRVRDLDAAFGFAVTVDKPDMPLQIGFFQWQTRHPPKGLDGPRLSLGKEDITPGEYGFHHLGMITVTPDSWIWFSAQSWMTHLALGERIYEPGSDNQWDAYVSLKCDGSSYGGSGKEDEVLVDRIVVVRQKAAE